MVGKNRCVKELLARRRAAVDDVGSTQMVLLQTVKLVKRRGQDGEFGLVPAFASLNFRWNYGKLSENMRSTVGEAVVNDVDVLNGASAQHERKANVPIGLHTSAKYGNRLDMATARQQTDRAKSSSESSERASINNTDKLAIW